MLGVGFLASLLATSPSLLGALDLALLSLARRIVASCIRMAVRAITVRQHGCRDYVRTVELASMSERYQSPLDLMILRCVG